LWAGNYTERLGNFFAVQDSLVTQLVSALPVDLPEQARRQLVAYSTKDSEAWQLYAHGRYQVDRRDQDSIRRAREYFEAAVARDPNFALAIAGLSEAWALSSIFNLATPRDGFNRARAAAQRALAIDPQLAPALVSLGHVRTQLDHAWEDARRLYRQAMARDPKSELPHTFMALNKTQSGSVTEALDHLARAQALEPASIASMSILGFIRYFNREYEESRRQLTRVLESVPQAGLARQFLARTLLILDDAPAAVRLLEEGNNPPAPGSLSNLGRAYARVGRIDDARAQVAAAEAMGAQGYGVSYDLALLHLALGDKPRSLAALEGAVDDDSQAVGYINVEPALDPIRDEPVVRAVARRIGLG
jgi:serine/threonine-protein kinase